MELKAFCDVMDKEIANWEKRVSIITANLDKLSTGQKEKVLGNVDDIKILAQEMKDKVSSLRTQCPTDWASVKAEIEGKVEKMKSGYESLPKAFIESIEEKEAVF